MSLPLQTSGGVDPHGCNTKDINKSQECQCHHKPTNPSVHQTLDELDFDRGMWGSAVAGDVDDVRKKLKSSAYHVNDTDKSGYTPLVST